MRTFFLESIPEQQQQCILNKRDHHHLFKTLRAREGDKIELIDGKGVLAQAIITDQQQLSICQRTQSNPPAYKLHLVVAVPKRQKMDQLLHQCTEVGVWSIQPIITEHSVVFPEKDEKEERWQSLLVESCKQSHNPFIPTLKPLLTFNQFMQKKHTNSFFGSIESPLHPLPSLPNVTEIEWIVGPEGGFSKFEETQMTSLGITGIRLGQYVLRVETAAIIGSALLLHHLTTHSL